MRRKSNRWLSGVGVAVFAGGLILANLGEGITSAQAQDQAYQNPFKQIMNKLNEILTKLNQGGGGGSGEAGNYTMRWDKNLPSASRFTVLADFNNAAVRDNSTGLVWEQNPSTPATDWSNARLQCVNKNVGGTRGWRLPSVAELTSVLNQLTQGSTPVVPSEFAGVQSVNYWSATSIDTSGNGSKWSVNFTDGTAGFTPKGTSLAVWCVRSPTQESFY